MTNDKFILTPNTSCGCSDKYKGEIYLKIENFLGEFVTEIAKSEARRNLGIPDKWTLKWGNIEGFLEEQKDLMDYLNDLRQDLSIPRDLAEQIIKDFTYSEDFRTIIEYITQLFLENNIDDYIENLDLSEYIQESIKNYIESLNLKEQVNNEVNNWLNNNLDLDEINQMIEDYIHSLNLDELIYASVAAWVKDNYQTVIDLLTPYIDQKIEDEMSKLRDEVEAWCNDIERVVANALIRHEQWIQEHSK